MKADHTKPGTLMHIVMHKSTSSRKGKIEIPTITVQLN